MKAWLCIPIVIAGLVITFFLTSCQNADEDLIVETVENDDVPIPSLFNESRSPQVLNGDCVIGTILFCGERLGVRITEQEVKAFLGINIFQEKVSC